MVLKELKYCHICCRYSETEIKGILGHYLIYACKTLPFFAEKRNINIPVLDFTYARSLKESLNSNFVKLMMLWTAGRTSKIDGMGTRQVQARI